MTDQSETPESYRRRTLTNLGEPSRLGRLPWSELSTFPIFPGTTLGSTPIVVPESWVPYGANRYLSRRAIDPTLRGVLDPHANRADAQRVEAIRRCMLVLWMTRQSGGGSRVYMPGSWVGMAHLLLRLVKWTLQEPRKPEGVLFGNMTPDEVRSMVVGCAGGSESMIRHFATVVLSLTDAGERGVLKDFPVRIVRSSAVDPCDDADVDAALPLEAIAEHALAGMSVRWNEPTEEEQPGQPFSDEFVTALIGGAMWTQRNLADRILDCVVALRLVKQEVLDANLEIKPAAIRIRQLKVLRAFDWRLSDGTEITRSHIEAAFGSPIVVEWPPSRLHHMETWVTILQGLNVSVLALCTGARASEAGAAVDGAAVGEPDDARFQSLTYKTVRTIGGKLRDWPLHPAGVEAIRLQSRLANLYRDGEDDHLWVSLRARGGPSGRPLLGLSDTAARTAEHLGLAHLTRDYEDATDEGTGSKGGNAKRGRSRTRANLHRWRHTVARLVALSIVEAPQVLLRLFGHSSLENTLHYMLSSDAIADDAKRVAEEAALVLIERALQDTLSGQVSGPAAARLASSLEDYGWRRDPFSSAVDDDDDDVDETLVKPRAREEIDDAEPLPLKDVAKAMSVGRRRWSVVRPGVCCSKTWNEYGPCNQGWGAPDVGACRTNCGHRVELSGARDRCRRKLEASLVELSVALADGAVMAVAHLRKRIEADLRSWPDVREDVLRGSELAREIWEAAA